MTKVSCLLVTQESRLQVAEGAIESYRRQTHEPRELVVVYCGCAGYAERLGALVGGLEASLVPVPETTTLGAARNLSVARASGEVVCPWDDDDICHPDRVGVQLAAMQSAGADVAYLSEQYYLFQPAGELYVRRARRIHGTAMFRKGLECRYPEEGPRASRGEDTAFLECVQRRYRVVAVPGRAELYLRIFHGGNTWDMPHHRRQVLDAEPASALLARREQVEREARAFNLSGVTVMGPDGVAFQIGSGEC